VEAIDGAGDAARRQRRVGARPHHRLRATGNNYARIIFALTDTADVCSPMRLDRMQERNVSGAKVAGFSLLGLMIAMGVTLVIMLLASSLVAGSFNIRNRENQRTEA